MLDRDYSWQPNRSLSGLCGESESNCFEDQAVTSGHAGLIVAGNSGKVHLHFCICATFDPQHFDISGAG